MDRKESGHVCVPNLPSTCIDKMKNKNVPDFSL